MGKAKGFNVSSTKNEWVAYAVSIHYRMYQSSETGDTLYKKKASSLTWTLCLVDAAGGYHFIRFLRFEDAITFQRKIPQELRLRENHQSFLNWILDQ